MRLDRQRIAPVIVWLTCLGAVLWLYAQMGDGHRVLGFAHGVEYPIAPLAPARVSNIAVDVGQSVSSGQVVATLDTTEVDEEIAVMSARRLQAAARLNATMDEAKRQALLDERELARELAAADARLTQARGRLDEAKAELSVQQAERKRVRKLVDGGMVDRALMLCVFCAAFPLSLLSYRTCAPSPARAQQSPANSSLTPRAERWLRAIEPRD